MRKLPTILSLIFIVFSLFYITRATLREKEQKIALSDYSQNVLGTPSLVRVELEDVVFKGKRYRLAWAKVSDASKIKLFLNLENSKTSQDAFSQNSCELLLNGGFYSKEGKPLGLFISEGNLISKKIESSLFDGIFSVNYFDVPRITRIEPNDKLRLGVQSGPLLIENSFSQNLSIKNDKPARRTIVAVTGDNKVIFMAIYDETSKYMGPPLSDLPLILKEMQERTGFLIADAINLDGGSASAFISKDFELSEASLVGSFFCVE